MRKSYIVIFGICLLSLFAISEIKPKNDVKGLPALSSTDTLYSPQVRSYQNNALYAIYLRNCGVVGDTLVNPQSVGVYDYQSTALYQIYLRTFKTSGGGGGTGNDTVAVRGYGTPTYFAIFDSAKRIGNSHLNDNGSEISAFENINMANNTIGYSSSVYATFANGSALLTSDNETSNYLGYTNSSNNWVWNSTVGVTMQFGEYGIYTATGAYGDGIGFKTINQGNNFSLLNITSPLYGYKNLVIIHQGASEGDGIVIDTAAPSPNTSMTVKGLPYYLNNTAAKAAGLSVNGLYLGGIDSSIHVVH